MALALACLAVVPALAVPASTLSHLGITVGPNPLRPVVNQGSVMTFRNLPAGCRVRIFSYVGEKLVDATADGAGRPRPRTWRPSARACAR